jgi:hypothetical protein
MDVRDVSQGAFAVLGNVIGLYTITGTAVALSIGDPRLWRCASVMIFVIPNVGVHVGFLLFPCCSIVKTAAARIVCASRQTVLRAGLKDFARAARFANSRRCNFISVPRRIH